MLHLVPALFGTSGVVGGAERYALELARHMAEQVPTRLVTFGAEPRERIIDRLNVESVKAMNTGETRASLAAMGGESDSKSPEQTAEFFAAEYARWGRVIRQANIRLE